MSNALETQIGGTHYKVLPYQPIELISKLNLNYFQGCIVKYISRNKDNKIEDLQKAIHYCELAIELDKKDNIFKQIVFYFTRKRKIKEIANYCDVNLMYNREVFILHNILCKKYDIAIRELNITV
jgi:hypothetical protein